jgi:hypothetical protein
VQGVRERRAHSEAEGPGSVATFLLPELMDLPDVLRFDDEACRRGDGDLSQLPFKPRASAPSGER